MLQVDISEFADGVVGFDIGAIECNVLAEGGYYYIADLGCAIVVEIVVAVGFVCGFPVVSRSGRVVQCCRCLLGFSAGWFSGRRVPISARFVGVAASGRPLPGACLRCSVQVGFLSSSPGGAGRLLSRSVSSL